MIHSNFKKTKWSRAGLACCHQVNEVYDCHERGQYVCTKHPKRSWCGHARCEKHLPRTRAKK